MAEPSAETLARWKQQAAQKDAIVPFFFEVFPQRVTLQCGKCRTDFVRNLVQGVEGPVFVCPGCRARNWVPVYYDKK